MLKLFGVSNYLGILCQLFSILGSISKYWEMDVISRAQLQTSDSIIERSKSFEKIINEMGSNIDPRGTPRIISSRLLKGELISPAVYPLFPWHGLDM